MKSAKQKTYNFRPSTVDKATRTAKAKEMNAFWDKVKAAGPSGIVCLREILAAEPAGNFFLFDGSSLLLSLDRSAPSLQAIAAAVARADLKDIDPAGYMSLLIQLAHADVDIGPLAAKYLRHPDVTAVLPQHAMTLDRTSGAMMIYGSMPAEQVDEYMVPALKDNTANVRAVAAIVLAINMTEKSFRALNSFDHMAELPPDIRREVDVYRKYTPLPSDWKAKFTRDQVITALRRIPHTMKDYEKVSAEEMKARAAYEAHHPTKTGDVNASMDNWKAFNDEFGPYTSLAGYDAFIKSAMLTLTEADLPLLREERRKQIRMSDEAFYEWAAYTRIIEGVINRLDLYKEYRVH